MATRFSKFTEIKILKIIFKKIFSYANEEILFTNYANCHGP